MGRERARRVDKEVEVERERESGEEGRKIEESR
jgi:hypothetical protein